MNIELADVANVMIGVSALVGLWAWRRLATFVRFIVALQICGFLADTVMIFYPKAWIINAYLVVEVALALSAGYYAKPSNAKRIFVLGGFAVFLSIWIATIQPRFFVDFQTSALVTGYVFIVGIFLWQLMQRLFDEYQDSKGTFVCFCMLFYFSVVTPLYSCIDLIRSLDTETQDKIYLITPILNTTQSAVLSWVFSRYISKPKLARG